jgi:hypothetical protein
VVQVRTIERQECAGRNFRDFALGESKAVSKKSRSWKAGSLGSK